MDDPTKERLFILAAIANILAVLVMVIPYLVEHAPYLELIPTWLRALLVFSLLAILVFIIVRILNLRAKRYPVSLKSDHILYTINDATGKLVHCEKNQLIRANHDFIKIYDDEIIVDGSIANITGSIEGSESSIISSPERRGMTWNVQHAFSRQLPKNKYVKRTFAFDFLDSFTECSEYILCRIANRVEDFQLSIIFPVDRVPHEIRGFLKRGQIEIEKESPPIHRYELPDKRIRVDWQVRWPRTGDIYNIIWNW